MFSVGNDTLFARAHIIFWYIRTYHQTRPDRFQECLLIYPPRCLTPNHKALHVSHLLNSHPGSEKIDSFGNEVRNDSSEIEEFGTHFSLCRAIVSMLHLSGIAATVIHFVLCTKQCPQGYDLQNIATMAIQVFQCSFEWIKTIYMVVCHLRTNLIDPLFHVPESPIAPILIAENPNSFVTP